MAINNADRQYRYKERALKDPNGLLLSRLQVLISSETAAKLDRISNKRFKGWTKRAIVERAINEYIERIERFE